MSKMTREKAIERSNKAGRERAAHAHFMSSIPKDMIAHHGNEMPVSPDDRVLVAVKVGPRKYGLSGPLPARMHDWDPQNHPKGIGSIVAFKEI